ncbi:MAG: type II toxin-antitoxin system HipA family toxin [Gemmatimonadota bacterium]
MSAPDALVHTELDGVTYEVGNLWIRGSRRGTFGATFQYLDAWLEKKDAFAVDPLLPLVSPGPFHKERLFGAIADSAPDRWGKTLMARAERLRASQENRAPRHLREIDYVLGVSDVARQGALRFSRADGGVFLAEDAEAAVPPLVDLPSLLAAAQGFLDNPDSVEDLRILLAPGSSLGGARPKASVRDNEGQLSIAKFPKKDDLYSVGAWEHLALTMAREAGIRAAESALLSVEGQDIVLLNRFDRDGERRTPFLSAMSLLDGVDQEPRSYLEIAEVIRRFGAQARADLSELWRRMLFNVLVSNTDDHLRNHGFLYAGRGGWTLSPAYDLNPVPVEVKPRFLSTAIGEDPNDTSASVLLALEVVEYFDLAEEEARSMAVQVAQVTRQWADRAQSLGIHATEIDLMSSAFNHDDLALALSFE